MNPSEAEEHLRIIRSLMERATIYRAISAPTALVGGLASLAVGSLLHFAPQRLTFVDPVSDEATAFLLAWGLVLLLTGGANFWFLTREARRGGRPFVSPGMKMASKAIFPAILAAGVLTGVLGTKEGFRLLPIVWMIFYGLSLLATAQISPQAIPRLGWAFLICGLVSAVIASGLFSVEGTRILAAPNLLMAITFGGLHLFYAVCTWSTEQVSEAPAHV